MGKNDLPCGLCVAQVNAPLGPQGALRPQLFQMLGQGGPQGTAVIPLLVQQKRQIKGEPAPVQELVHGAPELGPLQLLLLEEQSGGNGHVPGDAEGPQLPLGRQRFGDGQTAQQLKGLQGLPLGQPQLQCQTGQLPFRTGGGFLQQALDAG